MGFSAHAFRGLRPAQALRLVRETGSEPLADLVLARVLPPLLEDDSPPTGCDDLLPESLSELLTQLLHTSSAMRLPPSDFDRQVVLCLHARQPLGPAAARQAAVVKAAFDRN